MKKGAKSMGASALARHAYIAGIGSHASREDVVYTSAGNMPDGASEIEFWAAADLHDSGNLYREIELALPRELNWEQRIELAETFAQTVAQGSPYSLAIHTPVGSDGKEQPHVHLIFSERTNDGISRDNAADYFRRANNKNPAHGGAKKNREFKEFGFLKKVRVLGAQMQNRALRDAGYGVRVTHQSYESMGWKMPAGVHLGQYHTQKKKEGKPTTRVLRQREIEKAQAQYKELLRTRKETGYVEQRLREKLKRLKNGQSNHLNAGAEHLSEDAIDRIREKRREQISEVENQLQKIANRKTHTQKQQTSSTTEKLAAIQRRQQELLELYENNELPHAVIAIMSNTLKNEEEKIRESENMIDVNTIIEIAQKAKRISDNNKAETGRKPTTEQQEQRISKHTREDGLTR